MGITVFLSFRFIWKTFKNCFSSVKLYNACQNDNSSYSHPAKSWKSLWLWTYWKLMKPNAVVSVRIAFPCPFVVSTAGCVAKYVNLRCAMVCLMSGDLHTSPKPWGNSLALNLPGVLGPSIAIIAQVGLPPFTSPAAPCETRYGEAGCTCCALWYIPVDVHSVCMCVLSHSLVKRQVVWQPKSRLSNVFAHPLRAGTRCWRYGIFLSSLLGKGRLLASKFCCRLMCLKDIAIHEWPFSFTALCMSSVLLESLNLCFLRDPDILERYSSH